MKNSQKGFVIPLLIIIALAIGGGAYVYSKSNQSHQQNESAKVNRTTPIRHTSMTNTTVSENESIIQAILNAKATLLSGDTAKIRVYLQAEYSDNPKFAAQAKSADDKTLLTTAALLSNALKGFDATFLRTNCKITITGNTAKCSWNPTKNSNFNESLTVKKVNGVWQ